MDEFGKFDTQMLGITEDQIVEVDASEAEVVSRVLTPRVKDIVVTFRPDGITFNTTCVRSMKDGQLEMAVADEEEQGAQVSESAGLQDGSKTEDTVHTSMEQPDPTKDTPPIPSL